MSRSRKKNPYRETREYDPSCRCHGGCPYCELGKQHFDTKRRAAADEQVVAHETRSVSDNGV